MGLSGRRGRERREPRGVSDSKTWGYCGLNGKLLWVEDGGKEKWGTQIGSLINRHNSKRSSRGLNEALWGTQKRNDDLAEEGERNEWTQALKLKYVPMHRQNK